MCYNTSGLFQDSVLTELASFTFQTAAKIKECKALNQKTNLTDDEVPPDVIKVCTRSSYLY